jgi:hypothetical protein
MQRYSGTNFQIPKIKTVLYSGESQAIRIEFTPKSWEIVKDVMYISCSDSSELTRVELVGIPFFDFQIPKALNFGHVPILKHKSCTVSLYNPLGIDIDFCVIIPEQLSRVFNINPTNGVPS